MNMTGTPAHLYYLLLSMSEHEDNSSNNFASATDTTPTKQPNPVDAAKESKQKILAKYSSTQADTDDIVDVDSADTAQRKRKKTKSNIKKDTCPCMLSDKSSWKLQCSGCKQNCLFQLARDCFYS